MTKVIIISMLMIITLWVQRKTKSGLLSTFILDFTHLSPFFDSLHIFTGCCSHLLSSVSSAPLRSLQWIKAPLFSLSGHWYLKPTRLPVRPQQHTFIFDDVQLNTAHAPSVFRTHRVIKSPSAAGRRSGNFFLFWFACHLGKMSVLHSLVGNHKACC